MLVGTNGDDDVSLRMPVLDRIEHLFLRLDTNRPIFKRVEIHNTAVRVPSKHSPMPHRLCRVVNEVTHEPAPPGVPPRRTKEGGVDVANRLVVVYIPFVALYPVKRNGVVGFGRLKDRLHLLAAKVVGLR